MKRDIYTKLLAWKVAKRRKPLILRGARQVGKTTVLKTFGQNEFKQVVYLNFEADPLLAQFFAGKLDPKVILESLRIYSNQPIEPDSTLVIFDEIQECPEALNSLKYFQEQASEYAIASAGSLLGVKLANSKGFPVGKVQFIDLYPLSFFEFLSALEREPLRQLLESINYEEQIPEPIHQELIGLLKRYFFVGGMPEAVASYIANQDITQVRVIQQDILDAYELDFAKHANTADVLKISAIWQSIPRQLAKENKKFIFSALAKSARAREYEVALQWLIDAGLIHPSYLIETPKLRLSAYAVRQAFKIFMLDVGLLGAMARLAPTILLEGSELFIEFKGSFTENYVAQALIAADAKKLFYWSSSNTAEIDFIVPYENHVYPLEAKAGVSTKHKSLKVYAEKYSEAVLTRTNLLNLMRHDKFYNLPLYLISRFPEMVVKK